MKLKELLEKRNACIDEQNAILDSVEQEVRSLTDAEEVRFNELEAEVEKIDNTIQKLEERKKGSVKETEEKVEERGIEMNKELEMRGIAQYLRKEAGEELRQMTYSANGHLVPEYLHGELVEKMEEVAPLFADVPKLTPVSGTLRIAREKDLGKAGFVGESESISPADFTTDTVELKQNRAGSAIVLSQKLINDAGVDVVSYSNELLFRRLGYALDRCMITGNGTDNIQGLTQAPTECKVELATPETLTIDDLMKVASSMKAVYQTGAKWVMNRENYQKIAAMKDGNGHFYIVREQEVDGTIAYKLFGLTIVINDAAKDIYLVNFAHAYKGMIKKEVGLKLIDADQTNALAGTVTLVLDTYVDAKIVQPEAIRFLKVSE